MFSELLFARGLVGLIECSKNGEKLRIGFHRNAVARKESRYVGMADVVIVRAEDVCVAAISYF